VILLFSLTRSHRSARCFCDSVNSVCEKRSEETDQEVKWSEVYFEKEKLKEVFFFLMKTSAFVCVSRYISVFTIIGFYTIHTIHPNCKGSVKLGSSGISNIREY
jgi:hypothetical protein